MTSAKPISIGFTPWSIWVLLTRLYTLTTRRPRSVGSVTHWKFPGRKQKRCKNSLNRPDYLRGYFAYAEMYDEALEQYEQAALISSAEASLCFSQLLITLNNVDQYDRTLQTVTRLGSLRLSMDPETESKVNKIYSKSAYVACKQGIMLATYSQLVQDLTH
jgi:hypothetical protein